MIPLILVLLSGIVGVAWYRIVFHPLAKFPGPYLAACTGWYSFYYDVIKHGALLRHVDSLHDIYGDVVRVGPNELSFRNVKAYSDIFRTGSRFMKDPDFYRGFGIPQSSFGLIDAKESKWRREKLSTLFSRRAVLKLEGVVQDKVDTLVSRLLSVSQNKEPVNLEMAFRCTALETIMAYCLDQSPHALDHPKFEHPFLMSLKAAIPFFWLIRYIPALSPILVNPPEWLADYLPPAARGIFDMRHLIFSQLDRVLAQGDTLSDTPEHQIIYHHLLSDDDARNRNALSRGQLFQEALAIMLAGSDTLGNTCTLGFVQVLSRPDVHRKILEELDSAWGDGETGISLEKLEKLPYLTAVIKESLRLGHGVVTAMPRVVGPDDAEIGGIYVPAGAVVSMSQTYVHLDPGTFYEPSEFIPERWLDANAEDLEMSLVAFSKGPRSCLGVNLAWAELYLIFAHVFRRLRLSLHDTSLEDFANFDSFFVPVYRGKELYVNIEGTR